MYGPSASEIKAILCFFLVIGILIGCGIWGTVNLITSKPKLQETKEKPAMKITTITVNSVTKSDTTYVYPTNK